MWSAGEEVSELVALRLEVAGVLAVRLGDDGDTLVHAQTVPLQPYQLLRVVRDRPDRLDAEVEEDLRADAVVAQIRLEAELLVRLNGVRAAVLELVRLELVEQPDAASLLVQVDDHAAALGGDHVHRGVE